MVTPKTRASPAPTVQQMYADALTLFKSGQIEAAKKKFEEILGIWPKDARARSGLGRCLVQLGQNERGLEQARRAVKLDPAELLCINELTVILFNLGKVEESLKWAKRAVKMGPEGAKTNVIVANCYEKLHRIEEALEANRLAQIANPQIKYLKLQEAKLLVRNGDFEQARDILREASQTPGLPPEVRTQIFGELGRVLDKLKSYDQAYEAFVQSGLEASRIPVHRNFSLDTGQV